MVSGNEIFAYPIRVRVSSIDQLEHVNNREYLRWMEEAAIAHARQLGMSLSQLRQKNRVWVVRQHWIEYLRSALLHDELVMYTWVESIYRCYSIRRYALKRGKDLLMLGTTEWVYMDRTRMRPVAIDRQATALFNVVAEGSPKLQELGIVRSARYLPMSPLERIGQ